MLNCVALVTGRGPPLHDDDPEVPVQAEAGECQIIKCSTTYGMYAEGI